MTRPHPADCRCAIYERVQSSLAVKALARVRELDPESADRLLRESEAHAARLRAACDRGDHGPQEKR